MIYVRLNVRYDHARLEIYQLNRRGRLQWTAIGPVGRSIECLKSHCIDAGERRRELAYVNMTERVAARLASPERRFAHVVAESGIRRACGDAHSWSRGRV